ncbi:farnesyl pyrophosphate synthase [Syncephalis pseudoplumigaleata]|uniref:Farnesyl pyrophosphate synthase n=1 Tax=Syncephalis pseudoplumigaleata TaxID=1712513 RepID=A0A4P9YVP5_9FUNG|nr:farnesyl pyrophosphate synthase [Syncephalis pseudoplumigaleata]|eukprot:RKP24116.1 farnesyl pyrophosphate synthase [Syncephalis pseudoplumigaleata]
MTVERVEFENTFAVLLEDILAELPTFNIPSEGAAWVKECLEYTVPGGKMNRGLSVVDTLRSLRGEHATITPDELHKARVLGWCVEWLQAFFLVADDIMDNSKTRRGMPCWYRREKVGNIAINDAFILESCIYRLLKKYFRQDDYYVDLLDLFHETTYQTELGQLIDLLTAPEDDIDLNRFSIEKHRWIVTYKTAFYSFYLPVALAMIMNGEKREAAFTQARNILIPLGVYFQVQDDYLDCFGDPEVIGKIGTDIEDNKCSWLIVQALDRASAEQRQVLHAHYGRRSAEDVEKIKQIYCDLDLSAVYHAYEEKSYAELCALIDQADANLVPAGVFTKFVAKVYKRNK